MFPCCKRERGEARRSSDSQQSSSIAGLILDVPSKQPAIRHHEGFQDQYGSRSFGTLGPADSLSMTCRVCGKSARPRSTLRTKCRVPYPSVIRRNSERLAPFPAIREACRYFNFPSLPHAHVEQRQVKPLQHLNPFGHRWRARIGFAVLKQYSAAAGPGGGACGGEESGMQ